MIYGDPVWVVEEFFKDGPAEERYYWRAVSVWESPLKADEERIRLIGRSVGLDARVTRLLLGVKATH